MGSNFPRIALVAAICLLSLDSCLSIADSSNSTTTTTTTTTKKPITSYPISTTTKAASEGTTSSAITPGQPPKKLFDFTRKAGPKFGLRRSLECKYDKGPWEECKENVQQRTLRLRKSAGSTKCEPIKQVRRECKLVAGCKYMRGRWSATCTDGMRLRLDTLVTGNSVGTHQCHPVRRVVKDCKRACHYIKNPWSECVNGFKSRNLTLQDYPMPAMASNLSDQQSPPRPSGGEPNKANIELPVASENQMLGIGCVREKMIRKECRARDLMRHRSSNGTSSLSSAEDYNKNNNSIINKRKQAVKLTA